MRSLRHQMVLATTLGLAVATIAHAQRPAAPRRPAAPAPNAVAGQPAGPDAQGPGRPGARNGRGGPGGNPAARILGLRQQLELTDDQVKKLEALQAAPRSKSTASDQMRARADLMDAMQGDGNLTAARAAMDKMNRIRTDAAIARLKSQQDARAVLTAAQKAKLEQFRPQGGRGKGQRGLAGARGNRQGFGPGGNRGGMRGGMQGRRPPMGGQGPQGFRQGPGGMGGQMPMGPMPRGRRGGEPDSTGVNP